MIKFNKKRIIWLVVSVVVVSLIVYVGIGIFGYLEWKKAKIAIAIGGFPWQCGNYKTKEVQPGCVITSAGCTCDKCGALCNGSTQIKFKGQTNCNTDFACVGSDVEPKGGPIISSKQMILAGSSNLLTGKNVVVATQSVAVNRIEKVLDWFDFIIAGNFGN